MDPPSTMSRRTICFGHQSISSCRWISNSICLAMQICFCVFNSNSRFYRTTMWMANWYCDVQLKWGAIMQISPRRHSRLQEKSRFPSEVSASRKKVHSEQWTKYRVERRQDESEFWDFTTFFMMSLSVLGTVPWFRDDLSQHFSHFI